MPVEEDVQNITGTVVDVRGPCHDGSYELDLETASGEIVTVAISAEQYVELTGDSVPASALS